MRRITAFFWVYAQIFLGDLYKIVFNTTIVNGLSGVNVIKKPLKYQRR